MRAEYDSRADALSIDLIEVERWDRSDPIDDDYCTVALVGGRAANVELVAPREHLDLLRAAAVATGSTPRRLKQQRSPRSWHRIAQWSWTC